MAEGARPKVISSASESSSLPMGEDTLSRRAVNPSKKSNTAPIIINRKAMRGLASKANFTAMQPEMRLQQVMPLGRDLNIDAAIVCYFFLESCAMTV